MSTLTGQAPAEVKAPPEKPKKAKKLTPKQKIRELSEINESLRAQNLSLTESNNTLVGREQEIGRTLNRHPGEHPTACAIRVANERDRLATKVNEKQKLLNEQTAQHQHSLDRANAEIARLTAQLRSTHTLLLGAAEGIKAGVKPVAPEPLTTKSDMLDAMLYAMLYGIYGPATRPPSAVRLPGIESYSPLLWPSPFR